MLKFDIVIIGGGPAGSITGIKLQKKGYRTCIIDKSEFPREKLCGGLITQKTLDLILTSCPEIDPSDFIVEKTDSVDFYLGEYKITTFKTDIEYYFTERKILDNILIQEYKKNGGAVFENERIVQSQIDFENNTISTESKTWIYNFLVGADGCNGVLNKKNKIKRDDFFCIEGEILRDPKKEKEFRIYFGVAKKGYGWYFPKKQYYSVGIGGDNVNKTIPKQADRFFYQLGIKKMENKKGAFIPSGRLSDFSMLYHNTLVVGDAAGFIDPITGEGLYYAILSGVIAADSIDIARDNNDKSVLSYYLLMVKQIRKEIKIALLLQKVLYFPLVLRLFMRHLKNHKSFALFYLEKVMSTNDYNYINFIWSYIFRHKKWRC